MNDITKKLKAKLLKQQTDTARKPAKKVKQILVPDQEPWRVCTIIVLVLAVLWHLKMVCGWLNGATLVDQYGIDPILVDAILKCPDLIFYTTYISLALSLAMLVIILVQFVRYICGVQDSHTALDVTMYCSIATAWSFPVIHVIADLAATGFNTRDTTGLDAFQLGTDGWPMIVISLVCFGLLMYNKRVSKLMK